LKQDEFELCLRDPLITSFLAKFGGDFSCLFVSRTYQDSDNNEYDLPKTKKEFLEMVSNSLKQDRNLLLDCPLVERPDGYGITVFD